MRQSSFGLMGRPAPTDFCNRLIELLSEIRSGSQPVPAGHDGSRSKGQGSAARAMIHEFV
jgi:hypothetical protein